jgi:predicted amidohydrolase YtcJ
MRADLGVLDRNIFDTRTGLPADAHVTDTITSGTVVYEA